MIRKIKIATLVDPDTAQCLRDQATLHQLSLSKAAAELLAGAVKGPSAESSTVLFFAELRQTLHRDVARMADRLATLIVRGALEAGAARREVFNLLLRSGLPLDAARQIHDAAWQATVAALRKPLVDVHELAAARESAMETRDDPAE